MSGQPVGHGKAGEACQMRRPAVKAEMRGIEVPAKPQKSLTDPPRNKTSIGPRALQPPPRPTTLTLQTALDLDRVFQMQPLSGAQLPKTSNFQKHVQRRP